MGILPPLCFCLLVLQLHGTEAQGPFGAEQNVEGLITPRSNVVMQSVVLGRRRPRVFGLPDLDIDADSDCGSGRSGLRSLLRRLLGSLYPLPYKKGEHEQEETDAESLDPETLERMVKSARKMKLRRQEEYDDGTRIERLVDLDGERERPRKLMRMREGRRRRQGFWRRFSHEDDDGDSYNRRKKHSDEDEDVSRRWRNRRTHRRRDRDWEEGTEDKVKKTGDEERQKKTFEEEWGTEQKDGWHRRSRQPREVFYLPPQYPQGRNLLRPTSAEDYVK